MALNKNAVSDSTEILKHFSLDRIGTTSLNHFMNAYSLDIRRRIIDTVKRGEHTKHDIADMFNVHRSFIDKLLC